MDSIFYRSTTAKMKNHSMPPWHRPKSTMWNQLTAILAVMSVIYSSNKYVAAETTAAKYFPAAGKRNLAQMIGTSTFVV